MFCAMFVGFVAQEIRSVPFTSRFNAAAGLSLSQQSY